MTKSQFIGMLKRKFEVQKVVFFNSNGKNNYLGQSDDIFNVEMLIECDGYGPHICIEEVSCRNEPEGWREDWNVYFDGTYAIEYDDKSKTKKTLFIDPKAWKKKYSK